MCIQLWPLDGMRCRFVGTVVVLSFLDADFSNEDVNCTEATPVRLSSGREPNRLCLSLILPDVGGRHIKSRDISRCLQPTY